MAAPTGFSATQIRLHWIVFILIVLQYVLHEPISDAWHAYERGEEIAFNPVVASHVAGGILVLLFALWRIALRVKRGAPAAPEQEPPILKLAASVTHIALYALMILMPLSGMAAWFGGVEAAAEGHEVMRVILLALVALHVLGALYHQFILKTDVLIRMRKPAA
ncbi:cytochrome b/b6 domain-containing protein [Oricola sp.]|uniref:cytochrome b n=1 Tax=Oricola sp. TaxID=1979950 RepID=UPI0025FD0F78|nr:cytochrome b/b6 domain-containing protein [Oricola sp.]MCI5075020.1 cytochrome b/b6 domain-containing protein [Oricola sp.]